MNYKEALDELKVFLQTGDNFQKIFEQFFTLTETTDFIEQGRTKGDQVLGKIILTVIENVLGKLKAFEARMIYLPEYRFCHGPLIVNDTQGSFFYFEDISMGMVAVYDDLAADTKFLRFTGDIVPEDSFFTGKPSVRDH